MRWDELFADLEAQLAAEAAAEHRAEVADRSRRALAQLALLDRLTAHVGAQLTVGLLGQEAVRGRLVDLAAQWLLLEEETRRSILVPTASCSWVEGLSRRAAVPAEHSLIRRIGLVSALRTLAAHRVPVALLLTDGATVMGTIDRSYADHVDLALHQTEEARRRDVIRAVRAVPHQAVAAVRSR